MAADKAKHGFGRMNCNEKQMPSDCRVLAKKWIKQNKKHRKHTGTKQFCDHHPEVFITEEERWTADKAVTPLTNAF